MAVRSIYRFARVPEWIVFHDELSGTDIRLYAVLDRHTGKTCHPKMSTIASEMGGISEATIRRSITALRAVGAIQVEARFTDEGRQTSNEYLLAGDEPLVVASAPPRPSKFEGVEGSAGGTLIPLNESPKERDSAFSGAPPQEAPPAQVLLANYVDLQTARGVSPPPRLRSAWGGAIKRLVVDGVPEDDVRIALRWAAEENKLPSALAGLVMDVQAKRHERRSANGSLAR